MDAATQVLKFKEFIEQNYIPNLLKNLSESKYYLKINFQDLASYDPELAHLLLENPEDLLKAGELAIEQFDLDKEKKPVRIRFYNVPNKERIPIREIRSKHLEKYIVIEGIVRQKSDVRPQIEKAKFECPSCGGIQSLLQTEKTITEPKKCANCGYKGKFTLIQKELSDVQGIYIEESTESLDGGQQPKRLSVILKEDLVSPISESRTNPGSNMRISGILKEITIESRTGNKSLTKYDIILQANNIEALEEDHTNIKITDEELKKIHELAADPKVFEKLTTSLAPGIYGHEKVKEAILLMFMGGVKKERSDGVKNRGDTHILLIGDPGCIAGNSLIATHTKGVRQIKTFGTYHLEPIKEAVTQIRKGPYDKEYAYTENFQIYPQQPVLKLTTETGKQITGTVNQPYMTRDGWKRADEIIEGEEIRVMPKIPNRIKNYAKINCSYVSTTKDKCVLPNVVDEEFAGYLGYLLGDGHVRKYEVTAYVNQSEKDLIPKLVKIIKHVFGITPSILDKKPSKNNTIKEKGTIRTINSTEILRCVQIHSRDVAHNLEFLKEKRIPKEIFTSPKPVIASFISWLFEADGCCFSKGRGKTSIQLKAKSIELLQDVQQALLFFGIQGRIVEDNLFIRRSRDMLLFAKHIGFQSQKKKAKLKKIVTDVALKSDTQKRKAPQRWEKVSSIELKGLLNVYDFEVPSTHAFIANGILCHNSGKSQLLKRAEVISPKGKYVSGKGASGAGLCVSPKTMLLTNPGGMETIESKIEPRAHTPYNEEVWKEEQDIPFSIQCMEDDLTIQSKKPSTLWKLKAPEFVYNITLQSGKEIEITGNTQLFAIKDAKPYWEKSMNLEEGTYIATPRKLIGGDINKQPIIPLLKSNPVIHNFSKTIKKCLDVIPLNKKQISAKISCNPNNLYHNWIQESARGNIKLAHAKKILDLAKVAFPNTLQVSLYNGKNHSLPKYISKELLYCAGLIAGDGDIRKSGSTYSIRFSSNTDALLTLFTTWLEREWSLSYDVQEGNPQRPTAVRTHSKILFEVLSSLGIPLSPKSNSITMSEKLLHLDNELISEYIAGLYDADGSVLVRNTKGSNSIELYSCSEELIRQIQYVFLRFQIHSSIRSKKPTTGKIKGNYTRWVLTIRGTENILKFKNNIYLKHPEKKMKLNKLGKEVSNTNVDIIPGLQNYLRNNNIAYKNYTSNISYVKAKVFEEPHIQKLARSDIFWEKITKIEKKKPDYEFVYDVTVENSHNFVANGVLVHNTAAVVKDEFMGGWALEAGALPLSNRGVCIIDELDKMSVDDTSAMHEALEQQCYHYDFELQFADGSSQKIGDYVDTYFKNNKKSIIPGVDCEILDIKTKEILTTDFNSIKKIVPKRISRHIAPKAYYKLTYTNGRSITVTPEHPVFIYKDNEIKEISAALIKKGMIAPAPRHTSIAGEKQTLKPITISNRNKKITFPKELTDSFAYFLGLYGSEGHNYKNSKNRNYEISISNTNEKIIDDIITVLTKILNISISKDIQPAHTRSKATKDLFTARIISKPFFEFFSLNFPVFINKAPQKRVPQKVKKSKQSVKEAFLYGYFLGDGFYDSERCGYATSSSKMAEDLQDLLLNLNIISYIAVEKRGDKKYYKVVVSGEENLEKFDIIINKSNIASSINYDIPKIKKIKEFLDRSKKSLRSRDIVPYEFLIPFNDLLKKCKISDGTFTTLISRKQNSHRKIVLQYLEKALKIIKNDPELRKRAKEFEKFITSDIKWIRVKSVEKLAVDKNKWVYDVTVPPTKTFISQGLVLHNTISISKANIQARLVCETTVLAAANPKFGRFDPYEVLAKQINLPPALINRFDLIFPFRDVPDRDKDAIMADFILNMHKNKEVTKPDIDTELLRKYIMYARRAVFPDLTEGALIEIKNYYVKMRNANTDSDNKAIPISARQLEALIRLTEASAKVRLAEKATKKDAQRAVALLHHCLSQIGVDTETGQFDIDQLSTGVSNRSRNKVIVIRELIKDLEETLGKVFPIEDLVKAAEIKGIEEDQVSESVEKLKRSGDIFEPKPGHISRI